MTVSSHLFVKAMKSISRMPSACVLLSAMALAACAPTSDEGTPAVNADFQLSISGQTTTLVEGDPQGLRLPLSLSRRNDHSRAVQLSISGRTQSDIDSLTSSISTATLFPGESNSEVTLKLAISAAPIQAQQRDFIISASDGADTVSLPVSISVQPTDAPDVYLLAGQSNMVGFSGDGTRQSEPGEADAPDERIKQLNVAKNDPYEVFVSASDFTSPSTNIVAPDIVTALDPLHVPLEQESDHTKDEEYIGLGLSFAKRALQDTSARIVLVPAAWSGSSFCANDNGPNGNWVAAPTQNTNLGNSLLFERAVLRANLALEKSGGVLRGILWHQGESDSNEVCAPLYAQNIKTLVEQFRQRINPVGDGNLLRNEVTIPFVLGTMSRGRDANDDVSEFPEAKQIIDNAHRNLPNVVEGVALSNHDDLVPSNGFPCGNGCVHFGPSALRQMGMRYYDALSRTLSP